MKTYNGHRSWNAWNVALWINNDERIYHIATDCIKKAKNGITHRLGLAAYYFMKSFEGAKTPDGAIYNHLSVKLALEGFIED